MTKALKATLVVVPTLGITALMYRQAVEIRDKAIEQHRRAAEAAEHRPRPITIPPESGHSAISSLVYIQVDESKRYLAKLKEQRKELDEGSTEFLEATRKIEGLEKEIQDEQREADEAFKTLQRRDAK